MIRQRSLKILVHIFKVVFNIIYLFIYFYLLFFFIFYYYFLNNHITFILYYVIS